MAVFKALASAALAVTAVMLSSPAAAEDVLISKRLLNKRFIDSQGNYNMSFYHINDVHAHLDQFSSSGTDCTQPAKGCFGGYARVKTVIDQTRPGRPDSLFLNAGDEFQGTLFYTFYKGEKIAQTLNQMGFDGMTLGNHEFDGGDDLLADFLQNLTFPIISANIVTDHPRLNKTIKPFHIYEKYNLAVIGVTTDVTKGTSNPGKGTNFTNAVKAVQNTVDLIKRTTNIKRIVALTHIGYQEDMDLAAQTTGISLIMGGHSHTKISSDPDAAGPYPTIVRNKNGDEVFVVTAWRWGEFLGYIDVTFDSNGKILKYHGGPIHLTNATKQEPRLQSQIDEWRKPFDAFAKEVVGQTNVALDQTQCQQRECLLGDVMADAIMAYRLNTTKNVDFTLINAGGIRATIEQGPITRGAVLTAFPFGNAVVDLTYDGATVWKILEGAVSRVNQLSGAMLGGFIQISKELRIGYNPSNPIGSRLVNVTIGGKPLDFKAKYTMVTLDFIAGGGDNILLPVQNPVILDVASDVIIQYMQTHKPLDPKLDGRIATVTGSANGTVGGGIGGGNGTAGGGQGVIGGGGNVTVPISGSTSVGSQSAAVVVGLSIMAVFMSLL